LIPEELGKALAVLGLPGVAIALIAYVLLAPDKALRWAELLSLGLGKIFHGFRRRSVKLGIQSSLNGFVRQISDEAGGQERTPVQVEWTSRDETPHQFFKDGRLVVRLHSHEHQDRNLVTASMLVVSHTLIRRAKTFLSHKQARSIDLHAVDHVLAASPHARDLFREEVSGPECDGDRELSDLVMKHEKIDRANLFFPILVRELHYLEQRVVVRPRDERLIVDVSSLIDFLVAFADRVQGEDIQLGVQGRELRCAIMIVARRWKREAGLLGGYVNRLKELRRRGCDTVYLLGSAKKDNADFMTEIVAAFAQQSGWTEAGRRQFSSPVRSSPTETVWRPSLLVVLRNPKVADVSLQDVAGVADLSLADSVAVDAAD
jgi:hypothetical protein